MSNLTFNKIFSGEYLSYIIKYSERIQKILCEYDVVIFMARKAVCFYEAMVLNGAIQPTSCKVISSRAIEYSILSEFIGKKVAIIDDVVVKGGSLQRTAARLKCYNIRPDVLVVACERDFPKTLGKDVDFLLHDTYITLKQEDIYTFAGMITKYIEMSMCSFNVDQPIYRGSLSKEDLSKLLYHNHAVDISSGIQNNNQITSSVMYFRLNEETSVLSNPNIADILKKSILKIRIMSKEEDIVIIPFVLFSELSDRQLDDLFSIVKTEEIAAFIGSAVDLVLQENKMKIINYFLSEKLAEAFFVINGLQVQKEDAYDEFQFSVSTSKLFRTSSLRYKKYFTDIFSHISAVAWNFDVFDFPNAVSVCYQAISRIDFKGQNFFNSTGKKVNSEPIITHDIVRAALNSPDADYLASCVIDVFIDSGMIVPSILHTSAGIVRGYKMGEYSKLTRSEIEMFIAMLYEYQEMIDHELDKTELEKLCVLFFRFMQIRQVFPQMERYEDGCYSICYSLYGPRVSNSQVAYAVSPNSTLISEFCNISGTKESYITIDKQGKYVIKAINLRDANKQIVTSFAYSYSRLRKLFDSERKKVTSNQHTGKTL